MIAGLKPYPRLKDSGLPWSDRVPAHWDLVPNRAMLRKRRVLVGEGHSRYRLLSLTKAGVIVRDVSTGRGKFSADMGTSQEVRVGDLVFCLFDVPETPRTVGLSRHSGMITGAYTVFECRDNLLARFLEAFYIAMDDRKLLSPLYSGLRKTIPPSVLLGVKTPIPPHSEQVAIVGFLDHADRRIRRYIRAKQKLIKLLEEQEQAIIHRAVTRGLGPDVHLKPSGVEWLGDVPEHWEVVPSRAMFWHRNERAAEDAEVLTASQAYGIVSRSGFMAREGRRVMQVITGREILKHVEPDDFVMSMRSFEGGLEWSRLRGAVSSAYVTLVPSEGVYPPYFARLLKTRSYISALRRTSDLVRDGQALRYANFLQVPLLRVPMAEQEAIAEFLDATVARLGAARERTRKEVDLVREYRTRLIADVVTGKLDVREAAARVPEEGENLEAAEELEGGEAAEENAYLEEVESDPLDVAEGGE